jgi:flagellar biosynthesis protein FlhG
MIPSIHAQQVWNKSVWAVGGGKGGTGKSFVSANLGLHLSLQGQNVVLIDADFGGPNLHTFLGVKETDVDLGHFFANKISQLQETAILTQYNGLSLIKGSDSLVFASNLNYFKKIKLIRHIKAFDAQRVIIDIGTGASFNTVDFFLLSNPGILVINPEPTSIENTYYFLKSCILRLFKIYAQYYRIAELVDRVAEQIKNNSKSIYTFLNEIISCDKFFADVLYRTLKKFKPCLIVNKAKEERDQLLGFSMAKVVKKNLVVDLEYLGSIPFDEEVHWNIRRLKPFLKEYPNSEVSLSIKTIADKLIDHQTM